MPTTESKGPVTLIVAAAGTPTGELVDRGREANRALSSIFAGTIGRAVEMDAEDLRSNISRCLEQMKEVFTKLKDPAIDGWTVRNISVGLTITAEGSVGVATAGVEASIEIGFSPAS